MLIDRHCQLLLIVSIAGFSRLPMMVVHEIRSCLACLA
jgi:hypothetical protein